MHIPLMDLWSDGVDAVRGDVAVRRAIASQEITQVTSILAVGKAACAMALPAFEAFPQANCVILTKHGHLETAPTDALCIEAGHPIPDKYSLIAGQAAWDFVTTQQSDAHLLVLVSGGASAVAEMLPSDVTLDDLQSKTDHLIASGADIHAINTLRKQTSLIKDGKLLAAFSGAKITCLAISDVEGDALSVIGSGIGCAQESAAFQYHAHIIASNAIAREHAALRADAPLVWQEECLFDDIHALAPQIAKRIMDGPSGLSILGGEPTVQLPSAPGRGGRNQALALLLAREIQGQNDIEIFVAGTDGTDGPTQDAGAIVNGSTWTEDATRYISAADSGTFLDQRDALITTGPTGTNVMDLLIARKT